VVSSSSSYLSSSLASLLLGGFAYVYLVKDVGSGDSAVERGTSKTMSLGSSKDKGGSGSAAATAGANDEQQYRVLKVTTVSSRVQKEIAEKEAKLLARLSHPSIVKLHDTAYRNVSAKRAQHLILMEYCNGGHALAVCAQMASAGQCFDLSTLIIAFGQICNAVSYLHAQRPPIVHRDLKPENFLIASGAYKLCDFGSVVFGHVELKTSADRSAAEEVIEKTTTQMFRAPEMVDLYMAKKLTQATDVWALGCCLYALAFLKNCFEEGSNLAILSRNYKVPTEHIYGKGLEELLDRMLDLDSKRRADMTEVILCLSAVYSGKPLPPRKERSSSSKSTSSSANGTDAASSAGGAASSSTKTKDSSSASNGSSKEKAGTFRTDGQGIASSGSASSKTKQPQKAKKLDPNSAAARRRQAADMESFANFESGDNNNDAAFSTADNPFAATDSTTNFAAFDDSDSNGVFGQWEQEIAQSSGEGRGRQTSTSKEAPKKVRSRSQDHRRRLRKDKSASDANETPEEAIDRLAAEDDEADALAEALNKKKQPTVVRRQVRRVTSGAGSTQRRSHSRGGGLRRNKSLRSKSDDDDHDDGDDDDASDDDADE
jgi:serine/threonine protein kinase